MVKSDQIPFSATRWPSGRVSSFPYFISLPYAGVVCRGTGEETRMLSPPRCHRMNTANI